MNRENVMGVSRTGGVMSTITTKDGTQIYGRSSQPWNGNDMDTYADKDQVNADLLAFIKGEKSAAA